MPHAPEGLLLTRIFHRPEVTLLVVEVGVMIEGHHVQGTEDRRVVQEVIMVSLLKLETSFSGTVTTFASFSEEDLHSAPVACRTLWEALAREAVVRLSWTGQLKRCLVLLSRHLAQGFVQPR
jgi:hypothetical protein